MIVAVAVDEQPLDGLVPVTCQKNLDEPVFLYFCFKYQDN